MRGTIALALILLALQSLAACKETNHDSFSRHSGAGTTGTVLRIVDGDTVHILLHGRDETVRMIGFDAPEKSPSSRSALQAKRHTVSEQVITAFGWQAMYHLRSLLPEGSAVRLEFDSEQRDKYGRLLAYAFRNDGSMVNELMLRNGYGLLFTHPRNVKYVERFRAAQKFARKNRRGLWDQN